MNFSPDNQETYKLFSLYDYNLEQFRYNEVDFDLC